MQQELISIIVPIYKVEKYLPKCIESILRQTYENIEVILVDDGSPDNCGVICDDYAVKDNRVSVIHKENGGLSDARNTGVRAAKGDFLAFVDSDDYIAPDMYEHLHDVVMASDADLGVCEACIVAEEQSPVFTDASVVEVLQGEQGLLAMVCEKKFTVNAWNKLYKRELFDNIQFPVGMLYEDLATTYRIIDKANVVVISNARKYAYVQRTGSIMNQTGFRMKTDKVDIVETMWEYFEHYETNECHNRDLLRAGVLEYILNDIFKMMGSLNITNNEMYRRRLRLFVKKNCDEIIRNQTISTYKKVVLALYLIWPKGLELLYTAKKG